MQVSKYGIDEKKAVLAKRTQMNDQTNTTSFTSHVHLSHAIFLGRNHNNFKLYAIVMNAQKNQTFFNLQPKQLSKVP